jgi:hypothetical protein
VGEDSGEIDGTAVGGAEGAAVSSAMRGLDAVATGARPTISNATIPSDNNGRRMSLYSLFDLTADGGWRWTVAIRKTPLGILTLSPCPNRAILQTP